jgi:hypothetical protein
MNQYKGNCQVNLQLPQYLQETRHVCAMKCICSTGHNCAFVTIQHCDVKDEDFRLKRVSR